MIRREPCRESKFGDGTWQETVQVFRRLLPYLRPWKRNALLALGLVVLTSLLQIPGPFLMKFVVDDVLPQKDAGLLVLIVATLVALAVVRGAASFASGFLMSSFRLLVTQHLQVSLFDHVQRIRLQFHNDRGSGYLSARMLSDPNSVSSLFSDTLFSLLSDIAGCCFGVIAMATLSPELTLLALIVLPFYACSIRHFSGRLRRVNWDLQEASARFGQLLIEKVSAALVIKAYCAEDRERAVTARGLSEVTGVRLRQTRMLLLSSIVPSFVGGMGPMLILWCGGLKVMGGDLSLGQFIALNSFLAFVYRPVASLGGLNPAIQNAVVGLHRMFGLMDEPQEAVDPGGAAQFEHVQGQVEFDDVSFAYDSATGRQALRHVTLRIMPGEKIALVGRSGAGKTTLVSLLLRLYEPLSGSIRIDGVDTRRLSLRQLRGSIAIVPQPSFIFSGTIRDNIGYGLEEASESRIAMACSAAGLDEFIDQLPRGCDTVVGERGVKLSGGQRQRIVLARALARDARILVLDEATSEVDPATEQVIQAFLRGPTSDRTTIIIAHRLSTVMLADRVVFLDSGRVVAEGSHGELCVVSPEYAALFAGGPATLVSAPERAILSPSTWE